MRLTREESIRWSTVVGVHGASGVSRWKQLVPGHALLWPWEAIELARIPRGGVSGIHHHTRTHEIYFLLSGRARFWHNGECYDMTAGDLALTRRGDRHGLAATRDTDVEWLVIEMPARLSPEEARSVTSEEKPMKPAVGPVDLNQNCTVEVAADVRPLLSVGLTVLRPGQAHQLTADHCEVFVYLLAGVAVVTGGSETLDVAGGTGITLPCGEQTVVTARSDCRFFWARAAVEEEQ
jgi:mannose-6-phosphate isomerase-like protein (cupin superfamily)